MRTKIQEYVHHYFRFDTRDDLEALKQEIIANLTDRFDALVEEGFDEKAAYIEAIKSMGDFNQKKVNEIPLDYQNVPEWPEYTLPASAILGIFSVAFMFINGAIGAIGTAISIILYATGSYYLYTKSMHVKSNELDIELYTSYLRKIFKYMKTTFLFWSINIAFLVAIIVQSISGFIVGMMQLDSYARPEDLINVVRTFFVVAIVSFIVTFVIMLIISTKIYQRLMHKYYLLTGETSLKGKIQDSYDFIDQKGTIKSLNIYPILNYVLGVFPLVLFLLMRVNVDLYQDGMLYMELTGFVFVVYFGLFFEAFLVAAFFYLGIFWVIFSHIVYYVRTRHPFVLFQSYIVMFICFVISGFSFRDPNSFADIGAAQLLLFLPAVLALIYGLTMGILWLLEAKNADKVKRLPWFWIMMGAIAYIHFVIYFFHPVSIMIQNDLGQWYVEGTVMHFISYFEVLRITALPLVYFFSGIVIVIAFTLLVIGKKMPKNLLPLSFILLFGSAVLAEWSLPNQVYIAYKGALSYVVFPAVSLTIYYLIVIIKLLVQPKKKV